MIRQLVRTFRAAGVERVVVVTGLHSEQVRSELEGEDALLLHNPDFAHTDMLDSIKIGLSIKWDLTKDALALAGGIADDEELYQYIAVYPCHIIFDTNISY